MPSDALKNLSIANASKQETKSPNSIAAVRALKDSGMSTSDARRSVRTNETKAISSENLAPRAEATLATPVVPTEATSLQSDIQTNADTFAEDLQKQADQLEKGQKGGLQAYIDQLSASQGLTARTDAAYRQAGGVDEVQTELNDINDQIRREQRSLDLAKRNITEKGGGLAGGAQAELGNLERVSLQKQADLSIIQMAVQGKYDSAKAIADRAVSAALEKQTNDLAIAKFNYDENKELFTKAEQRAFEAKVGDRERKLNAERENMTAIKDFALAALQAGAPTSVAQSIMSGAKTLDEAIAMGGNYLRPKPAPAALVPTTIIDQGGRKVLVNSQTGEVIKDFGTLDEVQTTELKKTMDVDKISTIDTLKSAPGMSKAVGAGGLARWTPFKSDVLSGEVSDFIGSVDQLTKDLTLEKLANAKAEGVTFGALAGPELSLVADAATKINAWRRTDAGGNTTHYETSEKKMQAELDSLSNYAKLDFILKNPDTDPATVGLTVTPDGAIWAVNSNGDPVQLR